MLEGVAILSGQGQDWCPRRTEGSSSIEKSRLRRHDSLNWTLRVSLAVNLSPEAGKEEDRSRDGEVRANVNSLGTMRRGKSRQMLLGEFRS